MPLIVDIETVPLASALAQPYPVLDRFPPGNYKDPDAIKRWRIADEAKWRDGWAKECSLNPRLGRVLCIGYEGDVMGGTTGVAMGAGEANEAGILQGFWEVVGSGYATPTIVTWNGGWDLRFMLVRSMAHGIAPTVPASTITRWFKKYTLDPHFDCKMALLNWPGTFDAGEGLDEWGRFFGLPPVVGKGSDVFTLYQAGKLDDIVAHCQSDVATIAAMYARIHPYFR